MGLGNGLSNHGSDLRSPAVRTWGLALQWARKAKNFTHRDVAENVNVSIETVQLWELDDGHTYPSSVKLARLHGMMPQLRHFRHLIPKAAQKTSDFQEVADARKEAKPAPTEPTKTNDEKFLEALTAISNRYGSYSAVAEKAGMSPSGFTRLFHGKYCSPDSYAVLLRAFPELRSVPMPTVRGGNGKIYGPKDDKIIEALGSLLDEMPAPVEQAPPPPPPKATAPSGATVQSHGASAPSGATSVSSAAPGPAVAEPPRAPASTLEELSALYAKELRRLEGASKRYEEAMLAAMSAEEDKKAAEAAAAEVLSRLQVAAGLKREA